MSVRALCAAIAAVVWLVALSGFAHDKPRVDGELALEQRLMAPCCWTQTLDVHDSPIAKELRAEIRERLSRGDDPASIEADLVDRFGPRIVAMPASNPLGKLAVMIALAVVGFGLLLAAALRRWLRRSQGVALEAPKSRDDWDDKLDEELRESD